MISIKDAAVISNGSNISINSLFDVTPTTKYLYLNTYGSNRVVSTVTPSSGVLLANNKAVSSTSFWGYTATTILFELKNNQYVSNKYGKLSDIVFQPAKSNYLNLISLATADTVDPGLLFNMADPGEIVTELSINQYSASILTLPGAIEKTPTVSNIISTANSFIGKTWSISGGWSLINTISTMCGTSLPISSISNYNQFQGNDNWTVKYDGLTTKGDWKSMIAPGDVVFLSSDYMRQSTAAICVAGKGINAMVVDNVTTANNILNSRDLTIAPAHLLSTEDVYDYTPNSRAFILTLKNQVVPVAPAPINNKYIIRGAYDMTVNPVDDIKLGCNEAFTLTLKNVFKYGNPNTAISTTVTGLPSWVKYNPSTGLLYGTSPKIASNIEISYNFKVGTFTGSDKMKIIVDPTQLVDIKDTAWTVGTVNSLSINKQCTDTYYYTVKTPDDMSWLQIDQVNGILFGTPPSINLGHKYSITICQQHDAQSYASHVDNFTLSIINPITLTGLQTGIT